MAIKSGQLKERKDYQAYILEMQMIMMPDMVWTSSCYLTS